MAVLFGAILGGAVSTFTKVGIATFPPFSFVFIRFLFSFIIILPILVKRKNFVKDIWRLTPITLFGTFNIILFIIGIQYTTATIGQLLYAGVPLLTGLFAVYFLKENLKLLKILGIIIGFIGVLIVTILPILEKGKAFTGSLEGNILIILGVISWSFYMVFSKRAQEKFSPFMVTSAFILVTTIVSFPLFIVTFVNNHAWINSLGTGSILSLLYVAIAGTVLTYFLNQYAIKHGGSVFASMSFYLLPIVAFLTASVVLGEGLTTGLVIGGVLALLGVFFVTKK
jgi:drug/metabolite transporter (DMT)-like permease